MCKNQMKENIRILRSDYGKEFLNYKKLLIRYGIENMTSVAHNLRQNGKGEREMKTVIEAARTMLDAKNPDKCFGLKQLILLCT